jgi:hypothetical protein
MKICPVGAQFLRDDGRTDGMTKLTVPFAILRKGVKGHKHAKMYVFCDLSYSSNHK